jgi:hypothetical protein
MDTLRNTRTPARWLSAGAMLLALAGGAWADDPPARVGRLAWSAGDVTLRPTRSADAAAAALNWPVTTGNVIATGPSGRAEVTVGAVALRLDVGTEVEVQQLDDAQMRLRLVRGSLALRSASPEDAAAARIETPLGRITQPQAGALRVDLRGSAVEATAWRGNIGFNGGGSNYTFTAGQHAQIVPAAGGVTVSMLPVAVDDFQRFVQARDSAGTLHRAAQYVSPETTGVESLDAFGTWLNTPDYGSVWLPDVMPDWAPYRVGQWTWVAPWGWTWVDSAPWGFAPFHYGRWAMWNGRWAWVPGTYVARPVYAPALVAWTGPVPVAPGVSLSVGVGSSVGWFPLGPREVYVPPYGVSGVYVHNVNITHVTSVAEIDRVVHVHPVPGAAVPVRHYMFAGNPRALSQVDAREWQARRGAMPHVGMAPVGMAHLAATHERERGLAPRMWAPERHDMLHEAPRPLWHREREMPHPLAAEPRADEAGREPHLLERRHAAMPMGREEAERGEHGPHLEGGRR